MENSTRFDEQSEVVATPQEQAPQEQTPQEQAPQEQAPVEQEQSTPVSAGVVAAQEFVGPLIEEAMNGNENAKDIIARTAGEVAAATNRAAQGQAPVEEAPVEEAPVQEQPVQQQQSNEETVADEVVPPETSVDGQEKTSSYISGQDILNAINLFR